MLPLLRRCVASRGRGAAQDRDDQLHLGSGGPAGRSAYSASKFALEAVSDALRLELKRQGIHVCVVAPGAVDTPIWRKEQQATAGLPREAWSPELYGGIVKAVKSARARPPVPPSRRHGWPRRSPPAWPGAGRPSGPGSAGMPRSGRGFATRSPTAGSTPPSPERWDSRPTDQAPVRRAIRRERSAPGPARRSSIGDEDESATHSLRPPLLGFTDSAGGPRRRRGRSPAAGRRARHRPVGAEAGGVRPADALVPPRTPGARRGAGRRPQRADRLRPRVRLRRRGKQQPVEPESLFRIASVSKPFTAAPILQLQERGKLRLDDRAFEMLGFEPHPGGRGEESTRGWAGSPSASSCTTPAGSTAKPRSTRCSAPS